MSEEYANLGSVRRRPRPGHQRTDPEFEPKGKANGDGAHGGNDSYQRNGANGHASYEEEPPRSRRQSDGRDARERRRDRREKDDLKRERPLPWREIAAEAPLFRCPFDPWRLFGAVKRKTGTILLVGGLLAIVGFFAGMFIVPYTMSLPLIRITSNGWKSESALPNQFAPHEWSDGTLYAFMKSREVIHRVVDKAKKDPLLAPLNIDGQQLAQSISVVPLANPDWVFLKLKTFGGMRAMANLVNLYAREAVDYLIERQRNESAGIYAYMTNQLAIAEKRIGDIQADKQKLSDTGLLSYDKESEETLTGLRKMKDELAEAKLEYETIGAKLKSLDEAVPNSRLMKAQEELQDLLASGKTEKHWAVMDKRREIALLEKQAQSGQVIKGAVSGNANDPIATARLELVMREPTLKRKIEELTERISAATDRLYQRKGKDIMYAVKQADYDSATKARDEVQKAAREEQLYAEASMGFFRMGDPATEESINKTNRWVKVGLVAFLFGLLGMFITAGVALVGEALDTTLKTPEDIMRVCKLPVLASLGDLRKMSAKQQVDWAFRTLTLLKGKLSRNADEALVCGIISANHGEGRSTWVNLLVNAASQRGLKVLTVDTRPATAAPESAHAPKPEPVAAEKRSSEASASPNGHAINLPDEPSMAIARDPLSAPEKVTEQFDGPSPQALVHIPLPGWVWSLERRKQWQDALETWKQRDNLVIFVELPPACESESVLLAENLPQVIWLVGSGMPDAAETAAHLETIRHAHGNLVGAVLNHAPPPFLNSKIGRWLNPVIGIALLAGSLCFNSAAAENASPQTELQSATIATPAPGQPQVVQMAFSANARRQRANWQEHLTLGPGDIIDIHFFHNSALSRTNVLIRPDGRIDYLQAIGVQAAGLTIEELREKLDRELAQYDPSARVIVLPVTFNSKKYVMLGMVNTKGVFTLDRPITLIEAVARARGLETGLYQRTTVEMADLGHSFIVRNGEKLPVNFEKLFLEGDLSQNVSLEPNDYVYFASTGAQDIYVLGEVMTPGPIGFVSSATVISAITDRGGYTDRAFKRRVLVVRGSLNEPETFVINTDAALDGHLRDFRLQPRDIVYVSRRPWVRAEELADEAASSFIQGFVTTWAGVNIMPVISGRLLPRLNNQ